MKPENLTNDELSAAVVAHFSRVAAMAEAIREVGEVSSSQLYAMLMGVMTKEGYDAAIKNLVNAKLIEDRGYLLVWTGPELEEN